MTRAALKYPRKIAKINGYPRLPERGMVYRLGHLAGANSLSVVVDIESEAVPHDGTQVRKIGNGTVAPDEGLEGIWIWPLSPAHDIALLIQPSRLTLAAKADIARDIGHGSGVDDGGLARRVRPDVESPGYASGVVDG